MTLTSWELHGRFFMNVILRFFEFFKQCLELWPIILHGQVQIEWTIQQFLTWAIKLMGEKGGLRNQVCKCTKTWGLSHHTWQCHRHHCRHFAFAAFLCTEALEYFEIKKAMQVYNYKIASAKHINVSVSILMKKGPCCQINYFVQILCTRLRMKKVLIGATTNKVG